MTTAEPNDWIAVDWGTTNMRAYLVDAVGAVRAPAQPGPGMGSLSAADYEATLLAAVEPWIDRRGRDDPVDVLVCGMAGARQGWHEAPYAAIPTRLDGLLAQAVAPSTRDRRLRVRIVPGLSSAPEANDPVSIGGRFDVMRGEETQLLGLLVRENLQDALVCLPGTHSKWVQLTGGVVTNFATHMTGELFALLSEHSILRHSMDRNWHDEAFVLGNRAGEFEPLRELFGIRASGLLSDPAPGSARAFLSGLLIGAEIDTAIKEDAPVSTVHIVGTGPLADRYAEAVRLHGRDPVLHDGARLAVAGLTAMRVEPRPAPDLRGRGGTS